MMKTIRVIVTCYPCFSSGITSGLRESLITFAGSEEIISNLNQSTDTKAHGYRVLRGGYQYLIYPSSHCYVSTARNNGVNIWNGNKKKKQEIADCQGILFLDHDHTFKPEQVDQIVSCEKDIVSAAYPYRTLIEPLASCYVAGDFDDRMNGMLCTRILKDAKGMQCCDWVGGGFMYVRASVFGKLEFPWFRRGVIDCGDEAEEMGEDIGFCLQAKQNDIPVYCDCDNIVGHHK